MGRESFSESDRLFARLVVEQGLVTSEQLDLCLRLRDTLIERGADPPPKIGELLLRRGFLTPDKFAATLRASQSPAPTTKAPAVAPSLPAEVDAAARNPANVVGRYTMVSRLGAGGMGEVWRAWDRELRRWVALKFLKGENPAEVARFEREAQTAAALNHPNIAAVYDVGHHETRAYIALQLVNGRTLAAFPRKNRTLLARLVRDAALAVQYAHDEGVVHRDLKPHNLMVEGTEPDALRIYVMDFGLAKQTAGGSSLSASGSVLGTPAYMPPEQAHGRLREVDARSDVYSLGATLYELLADEPPFTDSNVLEILRKVVEQDPRPLRKINPAIDGELETIVMKCLEKDRTRRYDSARALAQDLDRWLAGEPILAHPPSVGYRLRKLLARRKAIVIPVAAAILCAAGFGGWALSANTRREEEKAAKTAALSDKASQDRAMKLLEAGRPAIDQASRYLYDRNADYQELVRRVDLGQKQIEQALEVAPRLASAHFLLGRAWELKGWEEKAEACWRKAIELDPDFGAPHFHLGRLLLERAATTTLYSEGESRADQMARLPEAQRLASEAAAHLEAARGKSGADDDLHRETAEAMLLFARHDSKGALQRAADAINRFGKVEGIEEIVFVAGVAAGHDRSALTFFDQALKLRPKYPIARFLRSQFETDPDRVIADLDDVIRINPRFAAAYVNRGTARDSKGDQAGYLADIEKALEIDPRMIAALHNRALARRKRGDLDGAIADYTEITKVSPRFSLAYSERAATRLERGDANGALADFGECLRVRPDDSASWYERSILRERGGDLEGARADRQKALELKPSTDWDFARRADARRRARDIAGAEADYTEAIRLNSKDPLLFRQRGELRGELGNAREGLADLDRCLAMRPKDADALATRGYLRVQLKDFDRAIADFDAAARIDPRMTITYVNRGLARLLKHEFDRAVADFTEALKINPKLPEALLNRSIGRYCLKDYSGAWEDCAACLANAPPDWPSRPKAEDTLRQIREAIEKR